MNLKNKYIKKIEKYILLKNGLIYDPFLNIDKKQDVLLKDGLIESIKNKITIKPNYKVVDCKNLIITNGFVDLHCHFRDPGHEYKETIDTGALAAFSGGFTRVCVMPNTDPVIDCPELVKYIINKSHKSPISMYPIGSITKGQKGKELSEIGEMINAGAVGISDDGLPVQNSQILRYALEYSKKFDIPVINHAEDLYLVNEGIMNEGKKSLRLGLPGNPDIAESTMVYRDLCIAKYVDGKIHVPHLSSKKSVEIIKRFKKDGIRVTAEVTPHHLCLTEELLTNYDTNAKVAPPLRSNKDKKVLIKAVKDGVIDCIATDHAPHSIDDKEKDIKNAPCGMIGLESAFGLVNKELRNANMDIKSIINLFTINPSKIINVFPNSIKEGNIAEINIINPNLKWNLEKQHIFSKSKNTPVLGMELVGKIIMTINKGYIKSG